jgi:nucleoside-diphosphate-sugar epimerase
MTLPYSRALVTGAAGFIGSQLCRELAGRGVEVHALVLDDTLPSLLQELKNITLHTADITDESSLRSIVHAVRPEAVFHFAAYGTFGHQKEVQRMIRVNIEGTRNLLVMCAEEGCTSFVYTGTAKEYATSRTPISEEYPWHPWDNYAATKAASHFLCRLVVLRPGMSVKMLRLAPVYGPYDDVSRFVPMVIRAALEGSPFTISVGSLVRNFTYVDDILNAFVRASISLSGGYEEFNIGAADIHSFDDILVAVEAATGRTIKRAVVQPSSTHDDSWVLDGAKARRVLGWEPRVSLAEGIEKTVEWYRRHFLAHT